MKTNIFKPASLFFCFIMIACQNKSAEKSFPPNAIVTWEVIGGDTCNRIDASGRKQGLWCKYNMSDNGPKTSDTAFYKDGNELFKNEKPRVQTPQSWEVRNGDTMNLTDAKGLRQGIWKIFSNGKVKDSAVYKDGSIVKKH